MKAFWLLCMCLCAIYSTSAQHLNADDLFASGDFESAAVAYEILYLLSADDSALLSKSFAYKADGNYEAALHNLDRITSLQVNYEKALIYYLKQDFESCFNQLLRIQMSDNSQKSEAFHLLYVMTLISRNEFTQARAYMMTIHSFGLQKEVIEQLIPKKLKTKSINKAYNISLVLPGIGQAYAGYPGRGFISGLMQVGSAGFTYYSLINRYYYSGVLTGAAMFYTFYLGGARYAGQLAEKKNLNHQKRILAGLKEEIKKANQ